MLSKGELKGKKKYLVGGGGGGGGGGLLAENFICCLLAEIRKLGLALYQELISM